MKYQKTSQAQNKTLKKRRQLIGAAGILKAIHKNPDWDKIRDCSTERGIEWKISPAKAPW